MSIHFQDRVKQWANDVVSQYGQVRIGVVTSFNPNNHTARVLIQPENSDENDNMVSGWYPVMSQRAGGGWEQVPSLPIGAQVVIVPDSGQAQHGIIIGCLFSLPEPPPQSTSAIAGSASPTQSDECSWVHTASGSSLRLCSDGSLMYKGPMNVDGDLTVSGDVKSLNGDVSDKHGSVDRLRGNYNTHRHSGGPLPSPTDPE